MRLYSKSQKYNEIYLLIKYIKSVLWRVEERLSYTEDAWCLKVNMNHSVSKQQEYLLSNIQEIITVLVSAT